MVGDPHFTEKNISDSEELTTRLLRVIKKTQPDFVVLLGDLLDHHERIHSAALNTATKLITSVAKHVPVYLIIGNHDYCLAKNTPVLMWDGTTKMSQDITVNDKVIGDDGTCKTIKKLFSGNTKMYQVSQTKGVDYTVTGNHILSLKCGQNKFWNAAKSRWTVKWLSNNLQLKSRFFTTELDADKFLDTIKNKNVLDISVKDYLLLPKNVQDLLYGYKATMVYWPTQLVGLDPYILGCQLNSGSTKYIPREYIVNDEQTRLQLLAGFIDTDGTVLDDTIVISPGPHLCTTLVYLCRSLGFSVYRENATTIHISGNVDKIPMRTKCIPTINKSTDMLTNISVSEQDIQPYYGWELSEGHHFLLEDFTVTHNCNNQQFLTSNHGFNSFKGIHNVTICDRVIAETINGHKFIFCPYVPPGRFTEALDTLFETYQRWDDATCIFAHQEFYGCKFNPIMKSTDGDHWDLDNPLVVSGHIHNKQWLQPNIYYTGSSMQHAFGETANKTIAMLEWKPKFKFVEIDLELRKKVIVYLDIEKVQSFVPKGGRTQTKLVLRGNPAQIKVFKKSACCKKLQQLCKISFTCTDQQNIQESAQPDKRHVLDVLSELIKTDDKNVHEAFDELVKK